MARVRAFIAITIAEEILARVVTLQAELRGVGADISWVPPDHLHLTLKFLGDVLQESLLDITQQLTRLAAVYAPFDISFAGAGGFPHLRAPRVLWVGIDEGATILCILADAVDQAMLAVGVPSEARPYRPHLTLGRVRKTTYLDNLLPLLEAHADTRFGTMRATNVRLMRSELSPRGARYTVLNEMALMRDSDSV